MALRWLTSGLPSLQLDIVGFLAILGEASVSAHAQVSLLSPWSLLPRLLPAPQALIRTSRPHDLEPSKGKVMGARSGGTRETVNHIAHLLHSKNKKPLEPYDVRCESVTKADSAAEVSAAKWGPLIYVEITGFCMSVALVALSIVKRDGFALIATLLLSLLSSLIGLGSQYDLVFMDRKSTRNVPRDSIVIKYPDGAFRIVQCDEAVARGLYWHPERCKYKFDDTTYRLISLVSTIALMVGVVCLANSTLLLQIVFAGSYLVLNALYWVVAALPPASNWDLDCYNVDPVLYEGGEHNKSFTQALWKAIAITESVDWVKTGQVAPVSEGWKTWVEQAMAAVENHKVKMKLGDGVDIAKMSTGLKPLPDFKPEEELDRCLDPTTPDKFA